MERPYVFCHMFTSVDGKINGPFLNDPHVHDAALLYDDLMFEAGYFHMQGVISGRVTSEEKFTHYGKPECRKRVIVPSGDHIVNTDEDMYYVSIDPRGVLGWKSNTIRYEGHQAFIIEVLTKHASDAYKDFLIRRHIPYIICGELLDIGMALVKLRQYFDLRILMLGGGAVLNWSFIQGGFCDELSVVIAPSADGSPISQSLFMSKPGLSDVHPISFELIDVKKYQGSTLWLRYKINKGDENGNESGKGKR